ncbi:acyl-CoA dehydrogenase family protein [Pseudoxanthomonas dokdonensis]|uniref:Acyl-CoA dehydrogenase n=1 Tax=Pseudoxanthomonas dokdonensis TaxID=344882 RepID=A0A0R0CMV3_9GAMM|nr:acyl-CoA dehydrogenase family protein [Pseudoxanthomonas dokdonensis]KRG70880.1 acyl-CoA dehydrogenase [Pseudoxanthomonas dokdonensis]
MSTPNRFDTHQVSNQPPPFEPRDLWADDVVLRQAVAAGGAGAFVAQLGDYARLAGSELYALGFDANRDKPRLRSHDRFGHRIDGVEFHPAYHRLMQAAKHAGVAGLSWQQPRAGAQVARAALSYLHHQVEAGTSCPLTMTHAAVPVLRRQPQLRQWAEKCAAPVYDPRDLPIADKQGVTVGMGMTEKQGGSDVRTNTTIATPVDDNGGYTLVGHKWFFSAPMSDGWLVLAQAPAGLSCFLLPRRLDDGSRNAFQLMRLKDKLGDWSNASSEVEFRDAFAWRVGEEGRGVATIIEMVMFTRLDCMLGSAAEMRMALAQAIHHARHRQAFGKALVEQPLMQNVLADLALESEAALAFALRVAEAIDRAGTEPAQAAFARVATGVGKYWICKRAAVFVNEAQECLGGAGYVEESMLPRLYRQAPLNSIWEGSGNIQCLDVLRALAKEPDSWAAVQAELQAASGREPVYDAHLRSLLTAFGEGRVTAWNARAWVEQLALGLQAAVLLRADSPAAAMFIRSRLGGEHGLAFGTLPEYLHAAELIERALPAAVSS